MDMPETNRKPMLLEGSLKVKDETENKHDWLEKTEKIIIPLISGILIGGVVAFLGLRLNYRSYEYQTFQGANQEVQRYVDRAASASTDRRLVLTDSAKRITDLVAEDPKFENPRLDELLRAEIIVTFKRLDDSRDDGSRSEVQNLENRVRTLLKTNSESPIEDLEGFNDSGTLKAMFLKFLYESRLINQQYANFKNSLVSGADLRRINLINQWLPAIDLSGAYLSWAQLQGADLQGANLQETDFTQADLSGSNLGGANLSAYRNDGTVLPRATNLQGANLSNATLRGANLAGAKLTPFVSEGVSISVSLHEADLQGANLQNADLTRARLSGADLRNADLRNADLRNADLSNADLRGADLRDANLVGTNLRGACYSYSLDNPNSLLSTKGMDQIEMQTVNLMVNASTASQEQVCRDF